MHAVTLYQQPPSTRDISTTMAPIDEAIAFLRSSDQVPIAEAARRFNVNRSTLSKRVQGKTGSLAKRAESNQLLSNKQELVLVEHIRRLSEWCLPPKPAMVTLWASILCGSEPGKNWSAGFKARHKDVLDSRPTVLTLQGTRLTLRLHIDSTSPFLGRRWTITAYSLRTATIWMRRAS